MDSPQIYVACLAAYNNGILHGQWIDAHQSASDIYDEIYKMLEHSPIEQAEEFAIHDFEGFGEARIEEYESIESVSELAAFIHQHGNLGAALLGDYSIEQAETLLEDHYHGAYDSGVDFAYMIFDDCYSQAMPEYLMSYFNYDAFARDLLMSDYFSVEADGMIHVFTNA